MAKPIVNAQLLSAEQPSRAIIKLAVPATIALLAKAVYNIAAARQSSRSPCSGASG